MTAFRVLQQRFLAPNLRLASAFLFVVILSGASETARAVILTGTADPAANTTPPTGALAGSGWQYEGLFGAFLGTAIGPHHFLTAKHIGVASNIFVYQGLNYSVTRWFDDPESDLRMFEVAETLPSYAPLYSRSDEQGQNSVVIGRGTQRGDPIYSGNTLNGWNWGPGDGVQRWGENQISRASFARLYATFDQGAGANEADLSSGDSGGAVFINDAGVWKLAGINSQVDGPFSVTPGGPTFVAAICDARGLYGPSGLLVTSSAPVPMGFYATRMSYRSSWILGILDPALVGVSARGMVNSTTTVSTDFVVAGDPAQAKHILLRGLGPSLVEAGTPLAGRLTDPLIELYNSAGLLIASNDNWTGPSQKTRHRKKPPAAVVNPVQATGLAPGDPKEAAILTTLLPGHYRAIVRGASNSMGIGEVDVHDLDDGANSVLTDLATNGYVGTGTQAMNGGLIVQCNTGRLLVRALGSELTAQGVTGVLDDPVLEIYDATGTLVATNDNWRDAANAIDIWNTGMAPTDDRDPAVLIPAAAGPCTVILRGANGATGNCRLEEYLFP